MWGLITPGEGYATHYSTECTITTCPALFPLLASDATSVVRLRAMVNHAVIQEDFDKYESTKNTWHKFGLDVAEYTFVCGLINTHYFCTEITANDLLDHLRTQYGLIHSIYAITIKPDMLGYWPDTARVPEYINMCDDRHNKASRANLTISDNLMVSTIFKTMLQSRVFPAKTTEWDKKLSNKKT